MSETGSYTIGEFIEWEPRREKPMLNLGDEVFVRGPDRFVVGATCIVGPISKITINSYGLRYWVDADVCSKDWPNYRAEMPFQAADLGHQIGKPISQLSGRPGHPGFGEFCRIARSWGYD